MKNTKSLRSERGQTATEYMMVLSVVVIGVVAGAYAFLPSFQTGVGELSMDVSEILDEHGSVKGGFGIAAANAAGGGVDNVSGGGFAASESRESGTALGVPQNSPSAADYGSGE